MEWSEDLATGGRDCTGFYLKEIEVDVSNFAQNELTNG
jgi:hypothetical protein